MSAADHASSRIVDATALEVPHEPADDIVAGTPTTGLVELGTFRDVALGIWEITPGVVRDVEADEVFVVLEGEGAVRFEDGSEIELAPGAIVRLHEGERTEWTIRTRLRKVYLA
ncbi:cupin domain-containing protein [Nocardioides daeguensis]|uniref:Cupin domain-containing protein n=1 Tax=Nocardioides daeguensis TaxID=908359 RepID=A0ABP6V952_9ACTN|nr:cupin domain-containing protein [Nocardioides daeguensis]MBV6726450.1 cupin domain-containing protein [Nocardioides daeguensis]MCR1772293.1 cupin domain-containing protein [Nocardioides daeguensis]